MEDMGENIDELVEDLVSRLTRVAHEFGERVEWRAADAATPSHPVGPKSLGVIAQDILSQRKIRKDHLPADLFHEPGWDMLLAIYVAHRTDRAMNVKSLVCMSDAPVATSQRWIDHLHRLGLVNRVTDPIDRRRVEVSLSAAGEAAMDEYLRAVSAHW